MAASTGKRAYPITVTQEPQGSVVHVGHTLSSAPVGPDELALALECAAVARRALLAPAPRRSSR